MALLSEVRRPKGNWWIFAAVFLAALGLRLAYFFEVKDLFFIDHLGQDAKYYDQMARQIADGNVVGDDVFFFGPLYPYWLAPIYAVFGPSLTAARLIQFLLGAVGCLVIYFFGKRFYSHRVGLLAAALAVIHGPFIMYQGALLYDQLGAFLVPLILLAFLRAANSLRPRDSLLAGVLLGVLALGRANVLLFLPFIYVVFRFAADPEKKTGLKRVRWAWVIAVSGCLITILPVTVRNYVVGGEFIPITANAGLNFYVGNGPESTGGYKLPEGMDDRFDFAGRQPAQRALGLHLTYSEISHYWMDKATRYIRSHPWDYLKLLWRKTALFWGAYSLPQIENYGFMSQHSVILRLPHLSFGLLAPLGIVGLIVTWRRKRQVLLLTFLSTYFVSIVAFFVVGRFRLLIQPVLMVLAAAAVFWLWDRVKDRDFRPALAAVLGVVVLAFLSHWNIRHPNVHKHLGEQYFKMASYAESKGEMGHARDYYQRATEYDPCHLKTHVNLGILLARLGDKSAAEYSLKNAIRCDKDYARPYYNLAILYSQNRKNADALALLAEATRLDPDYAEAWRAQGALLAALGRIEDAKAAFRRILAIPPLPDEHPNSKDRKTLQRQARAMLQQLQTQPEGVPFTSFDSR